MQISGSHCVVGTADFVSQQWVISPLSDNLKCFCWKLCIKRLGKLKISSNFLFFYNKSNQHFQKYSSHLCINHKAETALELPLLVGNSFNFRDTRMKCLFLLSWKKNSYVLQPACISKPIWSRAAGVAVPPSQLKILMMNCISAPRSLPLLQKPISWTRLNAKRAAQDQLLSLVLHNTLSKPRHSWKCRESKFRRGN